jgi:NAD/NADP transhydrogenase beta subunit
MHFTIQREALLKPLQLVAGVVVGAVTFGAAVVALWWLSGRPGGTESQLWLKLMELLKRAS